MLALSLLIISSCFICTYSVLEKDNQDVLEVILQHLEEHEEKIKTLEKQNVELKNELHRITSKQDEHFLKENAGSAFTAFENYVAGRYYNPEQIVLFENEYYDAGGHYDPISSVFTCPSSGVYMFSVSSMAAGDIAGVFAIQVGVEELSGFFSSGLGGVGHMGSTTIVVHCAAGTLALSSCVTAVLSVLLLYVHHGESFRIPN